MEHLVSCCPVAGLLSISHSWLTPQESSYFPAF
ncbi:unannotated protein [freshwater metagenome]|uniref:Unannotated protein n=1 Tax=freshwater metagenome TaxID=449393 RepID=A0A6J7DRR9_9ZZZZ